MINIRLQGITLGLVLATLFTVQPATADVIELSNFWAGSGNVNINFNGKDWENGSTVHLSESGGSGGFQTYDLSKDPNKKNAFQSFCVDIFHSFNFVVKSVDTFLPATIISPKAAIDLGRLFTNHQADISSTSSSSTNESAFQLAVWEIVNEKNGINYGLGTGNFTATGTGTATANKWLAELGTASTSGYTANIWNVQSMISGPGYAQDVVVFAPVPEPNLYTMMLVGLGLISFSLRRKKQSEEATKFS